MSQRKTYWEKLRDPRWQRRRLEIMQLANFACEVCADREKTLNVHHKAYRKGADPWDYEDNLLICLCEDCHKAEHEIQRALSDAVAELPDIYKRSLVGMAQCMVAKVLAAEGADLGRAFTFDDRWVAMGFAMELGVGGDELDERADELCAQPITVREIRAILRGPES